MRSIIVLIDHRPDTQARVRAAVELALRERARLTLLTAIPGVPRLAWCAPVIFPESPGALQGACERECEELLRHHVAAVPDAVPVTMSARHGRPHAALLDEVQERGHDLVVLDPPRTGPVGAPARARRRRFLRRCPAQVVVVAPPAAGAPRLTAPATNAAPRKGRPSPGPALPVSTRGRVGA